MQENNTNHQKQGSGAPKQTGLSWSTPASTNTNHGSIQKPSSPAKMPTPVVSASSSSSAQGGMAVKYLGMIVVGLVAGVVVAWAWTSWRPSDTAQNAQTPSAENNLGVNTNTVPALGSDAALTILSPQPAGTSVAVQKAIVSAPTWIVVYEDNNGKPGNALGAALFFPERQTGTVELLRATTPGKSYLAVKQVDNGDRKFSLKDDEYLSEGGEVQWVTFETR